MCAIQGGAAVLSLQGPVRVEPIVAQGCRPLTDTTWLVDKCENNIIMQVSLLYWWTFVTSLSPLLWWTSVTALSLGSSAHVIVLQSVGMSDWPLSTK